jgi:hypothetical protein
MESGLVSINDDQKDVLSASHEYQKATDTLDQIKGLVVGTRV